MQRPAKRNKSGYRQRNYCQMSGDKITSRQHNPRQIRHGGSVKLHLEYRAETRHHKRHQADEYPSRNHKDDQRVGHGCTHPSSYPVRLFKETRKLLQCDIEPAAGLAGAHHPEIHIRENPAVACHGLRQWLTGDNVGLKLVQNPPEAGSLFLTFEHLECTK
jgi:hypothetical protein